MERNLNCVMPCASMQNMWITVELLAVFASLLSDCDKLPTTPPP